MQVINHSVSRHDGSVTLHGRTAAGAAVTSVIPKFCSVWVRDAFGQPPPRATRVYRSGRGLLASDRTTHFHEYSFTGRPPRKDAGELGWYNRRLGKVEAWYAREGVPPGTWFTGTQFERDQDLCAAADLDNDTWAPFVLAVFDMECLPAPDGGFPCAETDPIVQISLVLDYDVLQGRHAECHLFTWRKTPAALPRIDEYDPSDCTVHVATDERGMLMAFIACFQCADPDLVSGWNISGFDLPYFIRRCELQPHKRARWPEAQDSPFVSASTGMEFCAALLGRRHAPAATRTAANGSTVVSIPGRIVADMLGMWRAQHKERSYRLADVTEKHLGGSKAPVHYSDMRRLWDDDKGRSEMATYCLKDSWLVWKLGVTRNVWMNAVQMSKVTYVPLDRIINGGQQIRVFTLLTHYAHRSNIYIPDNIPECDTGYEGAVVLPPRPGLYRDCVVTLDFASLYPSVMMAFNMCYTTQRTLVTAYELARSLAVPEVIAARILAYAGQSPELLQAVPADARTYHRCGSVSFRRHPRGILPDMLDTLLRRRKQAKHEMKQAEPGLQRAIADGKQLALKLVANSIYGFTGAAQLGMLPQPQIAAAVTYMGRKLTLGTKALCEREPGVTCVYGDTDSVFLRLEGVHDVAQASQRAEELAAMVDALIPAPNRLEFEKVYRPLLLRGKKRYCGRKYEEGQGSGELDVKGFEMVRCDNFPLLPAVQRAAMDRLIMQDDPVGADRVVRDSLERIMSSVHTDLADFTISKELTKPVDQYAVAPPHVRVARAMIPAPAVRDRVPYVVTCGRGSLGDRAVHPDRFNRASHELDTSWYAQQLTQTMRRVLELSSANVEAVFAQVPNAIVGTGRSGILKALGAPDTLVWRKSSRPATAPPSKRQKQMNIMQFM